jgi:hypothetical protein
MAPADGHDLDIFFNGPPSSDLFGVVEAWAGARRGVGGFDESL